MYSASVHKSIFMLVVKAVLLLYLCVAACWCEPLLREKPDPPTALPRWCNCTQRQSCTILTVEKDTHFCLCKSTRDEEVIWRFFQVTLVKTLAPVRKKVCSIGIERPMLFCCFPISELKHVLKGLVNFQCLCSQTCFASPARSFGVCR